MTTAGLIDPRSLRFFLRTYLARVPSLHLPLLRLQRTDVVTPATDIVIDGYFRSGNSFAFQAFRTAQEQPVTIAHHTHAPAQIITGTELGLPVVLLIRQPLDAAVSLHIRSPWISLSQSFRAYSLFYRTLLPHRPGVLVAEFSDVTSDFGNVIRRVNARFGTDFLCFDHSEENVREMFRNIDRRSLSKRGRVVETKISRPSEHRAQRKRELIAHIQENEALRRQLEIANEIYSHFTSESSR